MFILIVPRVVKYELEKGEAFQDLPCLKLAGWQEF
jgi:hypothetical protein